MNNLQLYWKIVQKISFYKLKTIEKVGLNDKTNFEIDITNY